MGVNSIFEFRDQSPFGNWLSDQYINDLETDTVDQPTLNDKPKLKVAFVSSRSAFFLNATRPSEPFGIKLYVQLKTAVIERIANGTLTPRKQVAKFTDTGITFKDFEEVYGVTLGAETVKFLETSSSRLEILLLPFLNWLGVNYSQENYDFIATLTSNILDFAKNNPTNIDSPRVPSSMFSFVLLLELAAIDLVNTTEFVAAQVLKPIAKAIRNQKLEESYWNASLPKNKYTPLLKTPSRALNELFERFDLVQASSQEILRTTVNNGNAFVQTGSYSPEDQKRGVIETGDLWMAVTGNLLRGYLNNIENFFQAVSKDPEVSIEIVNAFVVGLYNGTLDLLARLVDDLADTITLINPENADAVIDGFKKFIKEVDFDTLEKLLSKALLDLFSFLDGDDIYKNTYELGTAIPKFVEIALALFFGAKGVLQAIDIAQSLRRELPEVAAAFKNLVNELDTAIRFNQLSRADLQDLKRLGVSIDTRLPPSSQLNIGVPTKLFDGTVYTIKYRGIDLVVSRDRDAVETLLARYKEKQGAELRKAYTREKARLLKGSKNFKKYVDEWEQGILRYEKSPDIIDTDRVFRAWNVNSQITKNALPKERALVFDKDYRQRFGLFTDNIATGKVKVLDSKGNVIFERTNYISHSGKGDKIRPTEEFPFGSIETPNARFNMERKKYFDPIENVRRYKDSENALLRDIEEDIILAADKAGLSLDQLTIDIQLESTFEPCIVCKREILLRQQLLGKNTRIDVQYAQFPDGTGVVTDKDYMKFLKN